MCLFVFGEVEQGWRVNGPDGWEKGKNKGIHFGKRPRIQKKQWQRNTSMTVKEKIKTRKGGKEDVVVCNVPALFSKRLE